MTPKPTDPPPPFDDSMPRKRQVRSPIAADDPRIERVFEISRIGRGDPNGGVDLDSKGKSSSGGRSKGKGCSLGSKPACHKPRPGTPTDSDQEDRHEDDDGFPERNQKGSELKMQVSEKPRPDFTELRYENLGGLVWEILTGVEARTKFTNSELRHEGMGAVPFFFFPPSFFFFCLIAAGLVWFYGSDFWASESYLEATAELSPVG